MSKYNFTSELLEEINSKTKDIHLYLKKSDVPDSFISEFEKFHQDIRQNEKLVKHFLKKRENKLNNLPLKKSIDDKVWNYLHVIFFILESSYIEQDNELIQALVKKIETEETGLIHESDIELLKQILGLRQYDSIELNSRDARTMSFTKTKRIYMDK